MVKPDAHNVENVSASFFSSSLGASPNIPSRRTRVFAQRYQPVATHPQSRAESDKSRRHPAPKLTTIDGQARTPRPPDALRAKQPDQYTWRMARLGRRSSGLGLSAILPMQDDSKAVIILVQKFPSLARNDCTSRSSRPPWGRCRQRPSLKLRRTNEIPEL